MDITNVLTAINICVTAQSQEDITKGQAYLSESAFEPGYPLKLMMIADKSDLDINIRQFAVTDLKNSILKLWRPKKDKQTFSEEDKSTVRNSLLDALIRSVDNSKLSKMYCKIILDVCAFDFPKNWPNLIEQIVTKMNASESQSEIYGCCLALQQVFNNLQFEMTERESLESIIPLVFPSFQNLISKLMTIYNADNAQLLKPILRSFYMCINIDLPKFLQNYDMLSQWIGFLKLLMDSEMPADLISHTSNEDVIAARDAHPLWKNKKWAGKILTKFIQRYANKKIVTGQSMQALVEWLVNTHMESVMISFTKLLIQSQSQFVGNKTLHFAIKFVIKVFKYQKLYEALQPYIETVFYETIFPLLYLTPKDSELWEADPQEFIRQEDDLMGGNTLNHKNLAMDLIREISANPYSKNRYLHQFIQFCLTSIETNVNPRTNAPISLAIKDGIFFAIGQLSSLIIEDADLKGKIETLLEKFILPELSNPNAFIRSRSCWVAGRYGSIDFVNNTNVIKAIEGITACMKDNQLPVKFKAAMALKNLIRQPIAQEMVKGHLSEILRIYIKLMDEIDSEELVAALESIVGQFSNEIGPFAYDLCLHLSSAFNKYKEKDNEQDNEDDGECQLAAGGCLDAIGKILVSPIQQEVLVKLEEVILPIVTACLIDETFDYMEESLHLLQQLVYKAVVINSNSQLWFYYPILIYIVIGRENTDQAIGVANLTDSQKQMLESSVSGWGSENLGEIMIILKNFVQKGGDFFFTASDLFGTGFVDLLLLFVVTIYEKCAAGTFEDEEDSAMKNSLGVLYCLIENHVQDQKISGGILSTIIQLSLRNLTRDKIRTDILVANLETLCLCFYYNTQETFAILLNSYGIPIVQQLFQKWFALLKHFKIDLSKQRLLLAFSSILSCVWSLPDEIKGIAPQILKQCVIISSDIIKLREDDDYEDEDEDDDDDDDGDNATSGGQGRDPTKSKDFAESLDAHISRIHAYNTRKLNGGNGNGEIESNATTGGASYDIGGGLDDDDDLDSDFDPSEKYNYNYNYECPLENIDEILVFEQKLMEIAQTNQQYYMALTQQLTEQEKKILQDNITYAKKEYENYLLQKQQQEATANSTLA